MDISKDVQILRSICDDIKDLGVKYLTVYAFSTENWKRSREEVEGLMKLFRSYLKKCMKSAEKESYACEDHRRSDLRLIRIYRTRSGSWKSFQKITMNCIFRLH